jgi:replicative DNA helicase
MIQCETINRRSIEAAVLGSMTMMPAAADYVAAELSGAEFSCADLRIQFRAVCNMTAAGVPCDPVTLRDQLASAGELAAAGGETVIREVLEAVPHAAHCRYYVQQLQELHQRDSLQRIGERLGHMADDPTTDPSETIDAILNELEVVRAGNVNASELKTAAEAVFEADKRSNDPRKIIQTGLPDLDRLLNGGLRGGQLVVWGGRPGLGKTAAMCQVIFNAGWNRLPGLIASLEMTSGEIAERGLKQMDRQQFAELPVHFSECSEFSKLVAMIRLAKRRHGIQLAAVDYLQLIESPINRGELRERQIANMSRGLKRLAMELQIPILLGSQLNRESEKRGRPSLADLRESGAIEQDADIVILIAGDAESDERELIVAKHRGGPCGMVRATFDRPNFRFSCEPWTGSL